MNHDELTRRDLILIVDDDADQRLLFERWLDLEGYDTGILDCGEALLERLATCTPSAVCLDMHMPGIGGMETLRRLRKTHPVLPVVVLTADDNVTSVVEAVKLGAFNYMVKPVDRIKLLTDLGNAVERGRMSMRLMQLEREAEGHIPGGIIGSSAAISAMARQIDRVAACDITVMIRGASGTGKELVARAIHQVGGRKQGPFIALNCAAVPVTLQESELFGYERGSFTGATQRAIGRFEEADGGTLFLDEVSELELGLQAKLLRALQNRSFRRIGASQEIESDFRLLAATNRNLEEDVKNGRFREDLFFRIVVFELEVPPLSERSGDILLLAQHFIDMYAGRSEAGAPGLAAETAAVLESYRWPGNVRELENAIQHALVVCSGGEILVEDLPRRITSSPEVSGLMAAPSAERGSESEPAVGTDVASIRNELPVLNLADLERKAIEAAVVRAGGNLSEACRVLGIGRTTLYRRMKQYGVD